MKSIQAMLVAINLLSMTFALALTSCGRNQDDDTNGYVVETIVSALNGASGDSEQNSSLASASVQPLDKLLEFLKPVPSAYASGCGLDRFQPSIGSPNCTETEGDKTVLADFDGCSFGGFSLQGIIKLAFDAPATCDEWINGGALPTSGNVTRTSSNFLRTNPLGGTVAKNSDAHQNYLGESVSGGIRTNFLVGGRDFDILGIHRVKTSRRGKAVYDHSIRTLEAIQTTGYRSSQNFAISAGKVQVDHNLAKYSVVSTLSGIEWESACCYPEKGSVQVALSGSKSGSWTVDFATGSCGEVEMTDENGEKESFLLADCH